MVPMMPDQKTQKTDPTGPSSAQTESLPAAKQLEDTIEQALEGMLGPEKAGKGQRRRREHP